MVDTWRPLALGYDPQEAPDMADRPEDATTWFKVLAIVPEYRTYTIAANSEDEARIAFLSKPSDFDYDRGDDAGEPEVVDVWEDK